MSGQFWEGYAMEEKIRSPRLRGGMTRRRILASAAAGGALVAGGGLFPLPARAQGFAGTKLTYWGGLIFSDAANKLLTDTINAWGEANDVETEVVMINQNETVQKVSAAVEAGAMPDALDLGLDLLLLMSRQGVFITIDELYQKVGAAQGGWYEGIDKASDTTAVAGGRTALPFGASGNMLLRRTDLLEAKGLSEAPKTWAELVDQAEQVTEMPVSGLGLALSNVGDGNLQLAVLQSYGGRIADDAGKTAAIKSEETRAYLTWLKDAWDRGVFPPGAATWDGAGDNQVYLSGQAGFIANTGSVGLAAQKDDPELFEATGFSALPAGPKGTISPINLNSRAIPATSQNQPAALALLEHLSQPEFMQEYYEAAIYGPVMKGQAAFPAFDGTDPIHSGLLDLVEKGTAPGAPDIYNTAFADAYSNFIVPKMAQRVVIDGWDFDRAMDEAQSQIQAIYDKY
jgi:multiple sugar transport system substrate-binding protein